jgi:hypothetical protein
MSDQLVAWLLGGGGLVVLLGILGRVVKWFQSSFVPRDQYERERERADRGEEAVRRLLDTAGKLTGLYDEQVRARRQQ